MLGLVLAGAVVVTGRRAAAATRGIPLVVLGVAAAAWASWRWPAPTRLVTSVSLGVPFVPFGDATSRLATPIGLRRP